jgi:hypothetical protein
VPITNKPQFRQGKEVEAFLDDFFRWRGWTVRQTTPHEERVLCLGDRHFERDGEAYLIEYKSGLQTAHTGNVFLETISVDTQNVPGWVYTCQADYIFYAALLNGEILVFAPADLRARIDALRATFREVATCKHQNDGYNTHGVIVPLTYAERHLAKKVIKVTAA